jgi:2'-deoxynucleoside 5'-phosphate N-hydrolase
MRAIYFAGSIRGGRDDVILYKSIIDYLSMYGKVLTEHVGDDKLAITGEKCLSDSEIFFRDMDWLNKSKTIVAEVTTASLGVGYEIGRIVERNNWAPEDERKKILCLYRPTADKRLSAMIAGSEGLNVVNYKNLDEAKKAIDEFFM